MEGFIGGTMKRITKEQIQEYVSEVGEFEKEHRKYSSFYCWSSHTFGQKDIDEFANSGVDASELLGVTVTMNGMWDDSWGTDWDSMCFTKHEEYQELIPEVVIPAHYETKYREVPFDVIFD